MAIDSIHHVLVDRGREVWVTGGAPIVAGSVESDVVALTLQAPEQWEGLALALTFHNGNSKVTVAWDGESEVTVPWEAVQAVGWLGVALEGVEVDGNETVQRSLVARKDMLIRVVEAGPTDGVDPEMATPDLVDQAIAATAAANAAASSANSAAQSATDAASGADSAASDARSAAQTATDAATVAGGAASSANAAAASANAAAQTATEAAGQVHEAMEDAEDAADSANAAAQAATEAMEGIETYTDNVLKGSEGGAVATMDDAWPSALLGLTVYGNSVQDGTPTPEAPVPIKSVAAASVNCAGVNLFDLSAVDQSLVSGTTITADAGAWQDIFTKTTGVNAVVPQANIGDLPTLAAGTYTFSCSQNSDTITVRAVASDGSVTEIFSTRTFPKTFTLNATTTITLRLVTHSSSVSDIQIELGTTATDYAAYDGTTTPLTLIDDQGVAHELRSLPDGTRDELVIEEDGSGTLIENVGHRTFEGTEQWNTWMSSEPRYGYTTLSDAMPSQTAATLLCNHARANTSLSIVADKVIIGSTKNAIFPIADTLGITTNAAWLSWVSENDLMLLYKLATPRTYTIPAINMPQLPATVSNAWIDATDSDGAAIGAELEIGYRRDVNVVIGRLEEAIADLVSA